MTQKKIATLRSGWGDGPAFLQNFFPGPPARLFQPFADGEGGGRNPCLTGDLVSVWVAFRDSGTEFHAHAHIAEVRDDGLLLEFLPEENSRVDWMLAAARKESLPYLHRRHVRVSCELPVVLRSDDGATFRGVTTNLNEGGLHVALAETLPGDADVAVTVTLEAGKPFSLHARVVEIIASGPQRGAALEFLFASPQERAELAANVALVRARPPGDE